MDRDTHYDMKFIENFIQFGALHRARLCWSLLNQFEGLGEDKEIERGSIALGIAQSYLNAHEDLALWIQAIDAWAKDPAARIQEALQKVRFGAGTVRFTEKHGRLEAKLGVASGRDLAMRFGLPYDDNDDWSWVRPEAKSWVREEADQLAGILHRFFWDARYLRRGGELTFWKAWNKAKHGLQAVLARSHSWGNLVTIRLNPDDGSQDFVIRVQATDLRRFVVATFLGNLFLGRILNLLYQKRFECPPEAHWLELATHIDVQKLSRRDLAQILESSVASRQELVMDPRKLPRLEHFTPTGFELADDW